jgi:hypothetical protein
MNEAEWLACKDPEMLLNHLLGRSSSSWLFGFISSRPTLPEASPTKQLSDRKLRLYACACCSRILPLLRDERSRAAVEISEAYVDGRIEQEALALAQSGAEEAMDAIANAIPFVPSSVSLKSDLTGVRTYVIAARSALDVARGASEDAVRAVVKAAMEVAVNWYDSRWAADAVGAAVREWLLRDIFCNPFRPIVT